MHFISTYRERAFNHINQTCAYARDFSKIVNRSYIRYFMVQNCIKQSGKIHG